jgi:hypothetical protein
LNVQFDEDGRGGFVVVGKLAMSPEGWKEVRPGRFEPQWPECRKRGLSSRVAKGVPLFTVHCNHHHRVVGIETCEGCPHAEPHGPPLTQEMLERATAATETQGVRMQPALVMLEQDDPEVPEALPDLTTLRWPACPHREMVNTEGCCPKLKCMCRGHTKEGAVVYRKDCQGCTSRPPA